MPDTLLLMLVAYVLLSIALGAIALWVGIRAARAGKVRFVPLLMLVFGFHLFQMAILAVGLIAGAVFLVPLGIFVAAMIVYPLAIRLLSRASWRRSLLAALIAAALSGVVSLGTSGALRMFVVRSYKVASPAMSPTLEPGDRFVVDLVNRRPARWDVVVLRSPMDPAQVWISRIVGLPGENVELKPDALLINGVVTRLPTTLPFSHYSLHSGVGGRINGGQGVPLKLGADEYYVLGDNTEYANDSRTWEPVPAWGRQAGALPRSMVVGIARLRYAPMSKYGPIR